MTPLLKYIFCSLTPRLILAAVKTPVPISSIAYMGKFFFTDQVGPTTEEEMDMALCVGESELMRDIKTEMLFYL